MDEMRRFLEQLINHERADGSSFTADFFETNVLRQLDKYEPEEVADVIFQEYAEARGIEVE